MAVLLKRGYTDTNEKFFKNNDKIQLNSNKALPIPENLKLVY